MQRGSVLPLLLVVILFALLAFAGYYYFASSSPSPAPSITPLNTVIKPSPTPEALQTVSSEILGLKFELPKGFKLIKESEVEYFKRANGDIRKNFTYYIQYQPAEFAEAFYVLPESENNPDKAVLSAWVFKNPDNFDPRKFYDEYWYYPFVWGEFSSDRNKITPTAVELIGGREAGAAIVDYRPGKPKFFYLPFESKNLMLQIQIPTEGDQVGRKILETFKFE